MGYLLAQQLVAAGEPVVDVPATLASRVRLLGSGRGSKNDPNDALSTAIAALRHRDLRPVAREDHSQVLALLARRHKNLSSLRTQAICRLHAELAALIPGGISRAMTATIAARALARIAPSSAVETARMQLATDLLADVRRLDTAIAENKKRVKTAMLASSSSVTQVYGVGPLVAALILGQTGDVHRFAAPISSPATTAPHRSRRPPARGCGIGSTRAATVSSIMRCTGSRSPRSVTTPPAGPTTNGKRPTGKATRKHYARSNAASATPSTGS